VFISSANNIIMVLAGYVQRTCTHCRMHGWNNLTDNRSRTVQNVYKHTEPDFWW